MIKKILIGLGVIGLFIFSFFLPSIIEKDNHKVIPEITPEIVPEIIPEITHDIIPEIIPEVIPEIKPQDAQMNLLRHCLKEDKTDKNKDIFGEYMCGHFSEDMCYGVNQCFREHNSDLHIYPCAVRRPGAHAVAAIEINNTWYIIEPQTDEIWELSVYSTFYDYIVVGKYFKHFRDGSEIKEVFKTLNS